MADIPLGGKRGVGRVVTVSDHRVSQLPTLEWRVKRFPSGYEQIIRAGAKGWKVVLARLIMEQMLGRPLTSQEHVHHKDENTLNNTDANLLLMTKGEHIAEHNRRSESWRRACEAARNLPPERRSEIARQRRMAIAPELRVAHARRIGALNWDNRRTETTGTYLTKSGRWKVQFQGKYLGTYDTQQQACSVYHAAVIAREATR